MQAVKIHSVKSRRCSLRIETAVKATQPLYELHDYSVPPHPNRKPAKTRERFISVGVGRGAADIAMHSGRIRPICLNRQDRETLLGNETPRDRGTLGIKLVCAVCRFAQQHKSGVTDQLEQPVVIVCTARKRLCDFTNKFGICHFCSCVARPSNSRTSSSVVCEKSS